MVTFPEMSAEPAFLVLPPEHRARKSAAASSLELTWSLDLSPSFDIGSTATLWNSLSSNSQFSELSPRNWVPKSGEHWWHSQRWAERTYWEMGFGHQWTLESYVYLCDYCVDKINECLYILQCWHMPVKILLLRFKEIFYSCQWSIPHQVPGDGH